MEHSRTLARRSVSLVVAVAALITIALAPGGTATADPSLADAQRTLDELGVKLDQTNEDLNQATVLLKKSKAKQAALQNDIKKAQIEVDQVQARVGDIAATAYRTGRVGMFASILESGSPQTVLDQMEALDQVSKQQQATVNELLAAQKPLRDAKQKLDAEVATQTQQQTKLAAAKKKLDTDFAKWEDLRDKAQERADRDQTRQTGTTITATPPANLAGRSKILVDFAYAQLGDPYVFGAAGPDSWDCSGLTMGAYAKVGISLPHASREQFNNYPQVSRDQIIPGDIVFFYDLGHNGIYVGNNQVIHAPQPGEVVKLSSLNDMPYDGAVRP